MRHRRRVLALALTGLTTAGCFTYQPARLPDLAPDQTVRVWLRLPEALRLATSADDVPDRIDGRVRAPGADTLYLASRIGDPAPLGGDYTPTANQDIRPWPSP